MTEGSEQQGGEHYHDRVARTARDLAALLQQQGLEATLAQAKVDAASFGHDDDRYLMRQAANMLFRSGDAEVQEHGLGFLSWEAENFPDPAAGNGIAYDAKYDARYEESRTFAGRCFEISLMHFRFAAQAEDFVPTSAFFEDFNATVARIEEEGFTALYVAAINEFAGLTLQAGALPELQAEDPTDFERGRIDEALASVASTLRRSNPETAAQADALITTKRWKRSNTAERIDNSLIDAMFASDFETAQALLTDNDRHLIQRLWFPMARHLVSEDGTPEWGNGVIDTILAAQPEYFNRFGAFTDDGLDIIFSRSAGAVIGLLGRSDVANMLIVPKERQDVGLLTALAIVRGYGVRSNRKAFARLMAHASHFTDQAKDAMRSHYAAGQKDAVTHDAV